MIITPLLDRLLTSTAAGPGGCVIWTGSLLKSGGYGQINVNGGSRRVHRVAYELMVGPIPDGKVLDHVCHNRDVTCAGGDGCLHRRCINPHHLEPVSHGENARRSRHTSNSKNASKERCDAGHPFDEANTYVRRDTGTRQCKQCGNDRKARYRLASGVPLIGERRAAEQEKRQAAASVIVPLYRLLGRRPTAREIAEALAKAQYPAFSIGLAKKLRAQIEAARPDLIVR
ncbi:HNH endonuclease signature motif containing protein [Streptomyces sp. NPDC001520]|uniref:HNH endonuclease signature motif containing protein n=1 Tax=Streptomyces sp. NPDC001520 TaxID=3364581 RepID=UPI00367E06C9